MATITVTLVKDCWIAGVKQTAGNDVTVERSLAGELISSNIAYAPSAASPSIVVDNGTGTTTASNTSNVTTDPVFVGASKTSITDFVLDSTSPYVGAGAALKGYYDAFGNSRGVNGAAHDTGALQAETKQHRFRQI